MHFTEDMLHGSRRKFIGHGLTGGLLLSATALAEPEKRAVNVLNVLDFGAAANGTQLDTKKIQSAVDACPSPGGVLYFPPGTYLSGTIFLKSNICLVLELGATLLASADLKDYPSVRPASVRSYTDNYVRHSLLYGEALDHITITGGGTIDGQGAMFQGQYPKRPYIIRLIKCTNVEVSGIHLMNSPMWVQHYLECSHVYLHGLTVHSVCNANNDGIDLDACNKVRVSNCDIVSGDDAIVLKSTTENPCQNIAVSNCVISSNSNALKLGTESTGGFRNITMSNCTIYDTNLSGIAVESVDGGTLEDVNVSNITMRNVKSAIFLRLGNRGRPIYEAAPHRPVGAFRNVTITNVLAEGADKIGSAIVGLPDHPIENVTLQNIRVEYEGGGTKEDATREVPEKEGAYPEYPSFGVLPAYGFYCRHVRGLRLNNVHVALKKSDDRPAFVCDEVSCLGVTGLQADNSDPVILLRNTRRAVLSGNFSPEGNRVFVRAEGRATANIRLSGNDLSSAATQTECGAGATLDAFVTDLPQRGL